MTATMLENIQQDLFFILLTGTFFLLALLKAEYWKYTKLLLKGVFSQRFANQFLREDNVFTERVNIITFLILVINFSAVLSKILKIEIFSQITILLLMITLFYLVKIIIIRFLGKVFMIKELSKLIIFFSLLFDRVLAIIIFPLIVGSYFFLFQITEPLLISILLLALLMLSAKLFWLWKIGSKSFGINHFYIFLYLCTLEIFPILLLAQGIDFV